MATARLLDCRHGDGALASAALHQEYYVNWVRFLRHCESNGLCSIVANNYGLSGTGEEYHDEGSPAGENAWTYAEFDAGVKRFGILVQYAVTSLFGASPGNPGLINGASNADGVAIAGALRADGGSPWNGSTNANGADTKGATVWTAGGSTLYPLIRSNEAGGTHATNKENMIRCGQDLSLFARSHFVATENGIFHLFSSSDNGTYSGSYIGRYDVRSGADLVTEPYALITTGTTTGFWALGSGTVYGDTAGTNGRNGGLIGRTSDGCRNFSVNVGPSGQEDTTYQPNNLVTGTEYDAARIMLFQNETVTGFAGTLPESVVFEVYNTPNHEINAAGTLAYMAESTQAARKFGISWDTGAAPGNNSTREGRTSFTA